MCGLLLCLALSHPAEALSDGFKGTHFTSVHFGPSVPWCKRYPVCNTETLLNS